MASLCFREVLRNGEWVSESGRDDIKDGEVCIDVSDSYGCYMYEISLIPPKDNGFVRIEDTDRSGEKEKKFNEFLIRKGLPIYFKEGDK